MARIRQIKPDFFRSEDVAGLEPMARLLFVGLWTLADREGRLLDRPRRIAVELFPYDRLDDKVDLLLGMLAARELITRYVGDGKACIQITGFAKHQKPHPKEPPSDLPAVPPGVVNHIVGQSREQTRPDNVLPGLATDEGTAENVRSLPSSVVLGSGSLGSGEREPGSNTADPDPITASPTKNSQLPPKPPAGPDAIKSGPGILAAFGSRWQRTEKKPFVKGRFDLRTACELAESVEEIPDPDERAKAWTEIIPAIERYLRISKPFYAGHPFEAFAKDLAALRSDSMLPGAESSDPSRIGRQKIARLPLA